MAVPLTWRKCWRNEGEDVVGKEKLCELNNELSGWLGVRRVLIQEMFHGREAMSVEDVGVMGRHQQWP